MIVLRAHVFKLAVTCNEDGQTFSREATADYSLPWLDRDDYIQEGSGNDGAVIAITTLSSFCSFVKTYWMARQLMTVVFSAMSLSSIGWLIFKVITGGSILDHGLVLFIGFISIVMATIIRPPAFSPIVMDCIGASVNLNTGFTTLNGGCYLRG